MTAWPWCTPSAGRPAGEVKPAHLSVVAWFGRRARCLDTPPRSSAVSKRPMVPQTPAEELELLGPWLHAFEAALGERPEIRSLSPPPGTDLTGLSALYFPDPNVIKPPEM